MINSEKLGVEKIDKFHDLTPCSKAQNHATAFRKKVYTSLEELQKDADNWILEYKVERTHSGRYCFGKTPMQTFLDSKRLAQEKMLDKLTLTTFEAVK